MERTAAAEQMRRHRKGRLFEWNDQLPAIVDAIRQVCAPRIELNDITPNVSAREPTMMVCPHWGFIRKYRQMVWSDLPSREGGVGYCTRLLDG